MPADPPVPLLPKNYLRSCLLLLLREQPAHGYELLERLAPLGFGGADAGGLYRTLRVLERGELVRSAWERSATGPHRRIYEVTRAGMEELHSQVKSLRATHGVLAGFLARYEEFVALRTHDRPSGRGLAPGELTRRGS